MKPSIFSWRHVDLMFASLIGVVYLQTLGYGFVVWDDLTYILKNPLITNPSSLSALDLFLTPKMGYIVPITTLTEAFLYWIGQGRAWPFHFLGIILHVASTCLLFRVGQQLSLSKFTACVCACLFAIHPLAAEPVAWSTGLKEQLMAIFVWLGTYLFLLALHRQKENKNLTLMTLSILCLTFSILSKPSSIALGMSWSLLLWMHTKKEQKKLTRSSQCFIFLTIGVGGMFAMLNYLMQANLVVSREGRLQTGQWEVFTALGYHLHHFIAPWSLHPAYRINRQAGMEDIHTWIGFGCLLFFGFQAWKWKPSPKKLFSLSLFATTYLPISNLLPFPRFLADSYLYVPMVGWIFCIGYHAETFLVRRKPRRIQQMILCSLGIFFILSFTIKSFVQVQRWKDNYHLWKPLQAATSRWYYPWIHVAQGWMYKKNYRQAVEAYRQAFQHEYPTRYLSSLSKALLLAKKIEAAECLMVTDIFYGRNKKRAQRNYALFLTITPNYKSLFPKTARESIQSSLHTFTFPPSIKEKMSHMLHKDPSLSVFKKEKKLSPRSCNILKRNNS